MPYKTRLIGWLIFENEGFGVNAPDPSPLVGLKLNALITIARLGA
jgi:hypothetical protein